MPPLLFADGSDISSELKALTIKDITLAGFPVVFGRAESRSRGHLLQTISRLAVADQNRIRHAATSKRGPAIVTHTDISGHASKKQKILHDNQIPITAVIPSEETKFLEAPTQKVVEDCIARFIDRTCNESLATLVCVVCAREVPKAEVDDVLISAIPHRELLIPIETHPAHELSDGMLLYVPAITTCFQRQAGAVCNDCMLSLNKNQIPPQSLANGMWIGDVPFELEVLTLTERVLIARHLPAAHIVKLFPMRKGAKSLNSGLRGNVSTYRLDTNEIADMIVGNIMPYTSKILASTIGVTIVGPKNVPEKSLPGFLRVRRGRIRSALQWLKGNNPLYANIKISEERLSEYTEDGIPEEIMATMRYSDDVEEVDRERAGYVPEDEDIELPDDFDHHLSAGGEP